AILDVTIGLVFTFMAASLAVSSAMEAVSSLVNLRARTLFKGIKSLLNDPKFTSLAQDIYHHAAVHPLGPGDLTNATPRGTLPAYVHAPQFASAFIDVVGLSNVGDVTPDVIKARIAAALPNNEQLKTFLNGAVDRAAGDLVKIRGEITTWFDSA